MSGGSLPRARRRRSLVPLLLSLALSLGIVLGVPVRAAADGPTTFSNNTTINIPAAGAANQIGPANPYPSTISVTEMTGAVTTVTVTFTDLTHRVIGDIDAMVVAPTGENIVVMSDGGNVPVTAVDLTFADSAEFQMPTTGITSGTFRPTNRADVPADAFPEPAPSSSGQSSLTDAFTGLETANGVWSLYIVDDTTGDLGTMAGWSLTINTATSSVSTATTVVSSDATSTTGQEVTFTATVTANGGAVTPGDVQFLDGDNYLGTPRPLDAAGVATYTTAALTEGDHRIGATFAGSSGFLASSAPKITQRVDNPTVTTGNTFCNTGPNSVPDEGPATPYPSNIFVSGLAGQITKVTASLRGITHSESQDLDIMLSGPTPTTNLFLLSDVGGNGVAVDNADLVFDDDAPTLAPSPIVDGTYRPTRASDESGDAMPGTAPAPTSATDLSTFDGESANGTWALWVVDDASGSSGSISGGWCLTITAEVETETELTAVPTSSIFDQSVTFTAAVTGAGAPVTVGRVEFSEGATVLDTVEITADGTAPFTTDRLSVGPHTIIATYLGADNFAESDDDLDYVVTTRPTVTTVISSDNPSDVGATITFTATVTDAGAPVNTGTVQFSIAGAPVGDPVAPNADGQATYEAMGLEAGTYAVQATYSGTEILADSFGVLDPSQEVRRLQPTGTLTADPGSAQVNQAVTFTATFAVDGAAATPGTVDFADGATTLCAAVAVDENGTATCTTAFAAADNYRIQATFAQTATYAEETAELGYVVGLIPTVTTLADSAPSGVGDSVTFTATTVVTGGGPVPTGSVAFTDGATVLCAAVAVDGTGTATCTAPLAADGNHLILATYLANATYAGSVDDTVQVVNLIQSKTTVTTTPNPSDPVQDVTITATVESTRAPGGSPPSGTVTFGIAGETTARPSVPINDSGVASITVATMEPGVTEVTATYSGDTTYDTSNDTTDHEVRPVADAGGPYNVAEGASLALAGSSPTDGVTFGWDLNGDDDFTDAAGATPTLTWAQLEALDIDDGVVPPVTRTIRLRVTIRGVASVVDSADLSVTNTAPASVLTVGLSATVGLPFTVKVGADDPSSADMAALFRYTVDWGDGSPVVSVVGPADPPVTHTYVAAGDYDASFTATDKDGGTGPPTSVTVRAVEAPIVIPTPTPTPTTSEPDDYSDDDADYSDSDDSLASTGSPVGPGTIVLGLILLVGGGGVLLVSRRQRLGGPRRRG